jgi:hypothetical protein
MMWFSEQLAALNNDGLIPYAALVPIRALPLDELRWASWGKTLWRFHRAWAAARVTGGFPWSVWGIRVASTPQRLPRCPLCGASEVGLQHVLVDCGGTASLRLGIMQWPPADFFWWVLSDTMDVEELKIKVRYVGLCFVAVLATRRGTVTL